LVMRVTVGIELFPPKFDINSKNLPRVVIKPFE